MVVHMLTVFAGASLVTGISATGVSAQAHHKPRSVPRAPEYSQRSDLGLRAQSVLTQVVKSPAANNGAPSVLKYGDGRADGKQSLGGSGELIEFTSPALSTKLAGIRIHGSRYGETQPPRESFLIYFLSQDQTRVLHTELAPYSG
jgi:hypothetical protein